MVSQPLESSPMAGKSPQPSHGPPFQAPVTLKHDETVEGGIEGCVEGGDAKKNNRFQQLHADATATKTAQFDTPGCDEVATFHVSLTVATRVSFSPRRNLSTIDCMKFPSIDSSPPSTMNSKSTGLPQATKRKQNNTSQRLSFPDGYSRTYSQGIQRLQPRISNAWELLLMFKTLTALSTR